MALFGKRQPKEFSPPASLRADLRDLIEAAPLAARAQLLSPEGEPAFVLLNQRLAPEETLSAIVYSVDARNYAKGYMALTDERLIFALKPTTDAEARMLAIPLSDVTNFVFDSGMAHALFGDTDRQIAVGMPQCGDYPTRVCERIRAAVDKQHPDPYQV